MAPEQPGISLAQAIALLEALYLQGWGELTLKCQDHVIVHAFLGYNIKASTQVDRLLEKIYHQKKDVVMGPGEGT